jgi:NADPH:quinone reductase-like Zn-dependent oxidoreductase
MKAMVVSRHGGPDVLELREMPEPLPGHGEVRIRVCAAALNHLDLWVRRGHPGLHVELPHIPCSDVSGVVDAAGDGVSRFSVGDEVVLYPATFCNTCPACLEGRQNHCADYRILGENRAGGLAEYIVVPERNLCYKPASLSFEEAAAFPLAWLTSWHMLCEKVSMKPGDWVLVQAAASGTGLAALQIARLFGARVIATAGSPAKCHGLNALGAEAVINYREEDVKAAVREITQGAGCQVVLDHVGQDTFQSSLACLARGGSYVTCGGSSGPKLAFDVRHLFIKHQRIIGSTMGSMGDFQALLARMGQRGEAGKGLWPIVHTSLPMEQAAEAHRLLEAREAFGKVVLRVS